MCIDTSNLLSTIYFTLTELTEKYNHDNWVIHISRIKYNSQLKKLLTITRSI